MKKITFLLTITCLFLVNSLLAQTPNFSGQANQRKGYDQQEFTFINEYNRMLWKFLRAVDAVKDGYYKSDLTWKATAQGTITSLMPYVDNSLFTGQSMLRTLNNERDMLAKTAYDENSQRLTSLFQNAVQNTQEGVEEILKYYSTPWKIQTDAQAGDVHKKGGWTKTWEAMRDLVSKSRSFFSAIGQSQNPLLPYVEANVVTDLLPPIMVAPTADAGAPFFGFWYKLGTTQLVVSEPPVTDVPLFSGDIILGIYKFGTPSSNSDTEYDASYGAERTLFETPTIVAFTKEFNQRRGLVGKTLRFLVRRDGKEVKVDMKCSAAEGGNIFQR